MAPGTDFLPKGTDDMAGGIRHGSKKWKLQLPYRTSQSKMSGLESESQELKGRPAGGTERGREAQKLRVRNSQTRLSANVILITTTRDKVLQLPASMHAQSLSCVRHFATLWTVACQASLSMGFSRQEYWSGFSRPPPGDLSDPGIETECLPPISRLGIK